MKNAKDESKSITILMAEDDPEDRMLVQDALTESRLANDFRFVSDGEELMNYLHREGPYADPSRSPRPGLILLDLNMPRKDGREALQEIKSDPDLQAIPVVVLTTSKEEEDVACSYVTGANSYITKPVTFEKLVSIMKVIEKYWFKIVALPPEGGSPDDG